MTYTPDDVDCLLAEVYTPDGIDHWWNAHNFNLDGERPSDLWIEGGASRAMVATEAQRLADEAQ